MHGLHAMQAVRLKPGALVETDEIKQNSPSATKSSLINEHVIKPGTQE